MVKAYKKAVICMCILSAGLFAACTRQKNGEEPGISADMEAGSSNSENAGDELGSNTENESGSTEEESAVWQEPSADQPENAVQTVEDKNPETFPLGEYLDDMGSQLFIYQGDDESYYVTYSIYRLTYVENTVGNYDVTSGILSFSGTDITGAVLAADVAIEGDNLIVTLTQSAYPDCPTGTAFVFKPMDEPADEPVENNQECTIVVIFDRYEDDMIVVRDGEDEDIIMYFYYKDAEVIEGDTPIAHGDIIELTYRGVQGDDIGEYPGNAVKIVAESMMYE